MSGKLTESQRAMLGAPKRDEAGNIVRHSLSNTGPDNRTALALERKGLIAWKQNFDWGGRWIITDAGRSALNQGGSDE